ncbi:MAG: MBOAT family protein [Clostridiales Family XIII bacterium]|jgi:alginate O-acetyltransferase complex protein AlgI|nr:MBOAT family protein [Clostridiales Family XIII bacterium]
MVFSSLVFLGLYLPVILLLYFLSLRLSDNFKIANKVVLAGSLFFYSWGEPLWIVAMLFTSTVDYINGRRIGAAKEQYNGLGRLKGIVISSIIINLGILFFFKYLGFALENIGNIFSVDIQFTSPDLPIGISFYTFQSLSYIIDVYRGRTGVQKNYFDYILYVSMFPQLVAGPIVRYSDIEQQIRGRTVTMSDFGTGVQRFCIGLGKKVVLANSAGSAAVMLLDGSLTELPALGAWLGITFFTFQIYFDFSGYSDMAIGIGRMFGFKYNENFRHPYISTSITEFWRRWHISLGAFFRDFLYIPLGGNRSHQVRNILVVWFLTGLWHGASWNFIAWGMYYGVLLLIEKHTASYLAKIPVAIRWAVTMLIVLFGWGLFYFVDPTRLYHFIRAFFFMNPTPIIDLKTSSVFFQFFWMIPIFIIGSSPMPGKLFNKLLAERPKLDFIRSILVAALLAVCFMLLVGESYNPFLYFRF